jgi:predicted RNA-binding protein YlqC (UPF0109 family)
MTESTPPPSRTDQIVDYVQYVVESLVDNPDAVNVTESWEDGELFIDVEVADDERGRVIGKGGRLIRSLRVIVRAAAGRDGTRASVEIVEPDAGSSVAVGEQASAGSDSGASADE